MRAQVVLYFRSPENVLCDISRKRLEKSSEMDDKRSSVSPVAPVVHDLLDVHNAW